MTADPVKLLGEFQAAQGVATKLFRQASKSMPSASDVTRQAIFEALGHPPYDIEYIKNNFSDLVHGLQTSAYGLYLASERDVCGPVIADFVRSTAGSDSSADLLESLSRSFFVLDRFCLSLTQSRRTRAGAAFETVVTTLFEALNYSYTFQPELSGSRPDFVLPGIEHYRAFATDCLIFTCKRTLRERWRQVVTEGMTGKAFYLATIDEGLSGAELARMKDRNVVVVVPANIKKLNYPDVYNVISFEAFFDHHLDPAVQRWKANGVI